MGSRLEIGEPSANMALIRERDFRSAMAMQGQNSMRARWRQGLLEWSDIAFIALATLASIALMFGLFVVHFGYSWRQSERAEACSANLRTLDLSKNEYAVDQHLKDGAAVPAGALWSDEGYIKSAPECADGGRYTIGRIGEPPTCSVGGKHSIYATFSTSD
jgi:hypothetical protein